MSNQKIEGYRSDNKLSVPARAFIFPIFTAMMSVLVSGFDFVAVALISCGRAMIPMMATPGGRIFAKRSTAVRLALAT